MNNGEQTLFAFNIALKDINPENIGAIVKDLDAIDFSPTTTYRRPPKVSVRHDYPDRQGWEAAFAKAKNSDGKFRYEKIVLARRSVLISTFISTPPP